MLPPNTNYNIGTAIKAYVGYEGKAIYGLSSNSDTYPNAFAGYFEGKTYFSGKVGIGTTNSGAHSLTVNGKSYFMGNVGINCSNPAYALCVSGKIQATEIEVKTAPCSDFVFEKGYKLMSLSELENFVNTNKHLPEVPSAKEFAENGYSVGQMDDLLLRKVEELTLYVIELKKEIAAMKQEQAATANELSK